MPDVQSSYEVRLTRQALKDLKRLKSQTDAIALALDRLRLDPTTGHALRGSLAGVRSLEFTLEGGGAGRAAYLDIPDHRVCLVFIIGPHEGFYERTARRAASLDISGKFTN